MTKHLLGPLSYLERDNTLPSTNLWEKNEKNWDSLDSNQVILNELETDKSLKRGTKFFALDNGLASERGFSKDLQNLNDDEDCIQTYDPYSNQQHRDNYFLSTDGDLLAIE